MLMSYLVQLKPEILIQNCLASVLALCLFLPSSRLPSCQPLGDAIPDILRVRDDNDFTTLSQCSQPFDNCSKLHPIVGRSLLTAEHFSGPIHITKDTSPAPRPGIADARPVSCQINSFH